MKKIMSLVYREFVLMRKKLLLALAVTAGMAAVFLIIGFSFRNGAFDGNEKLHDLFTKTGGHLEAYLMMFFLIPVVETCADAYESDIKSNWARYSMTLPAETKLRALAHVLFLLVRTAAAFLIVTVLSVLVSAAFGKTLSTGMIADIGLWICLALIPVCIIEFFLGKAKDPIAYKKQQNRIPVAFAGCGTVAGLLLARTMKSAGPDTDPITAMKPLLEKYTAFRDAVLPFIIPVFIGLLVLIYVIVKRNYAGPKRA